MRFAWLVLVTMAIVLSGCKKQDEIVLPDDTYVYEPVRVAAVYTALLEKPEAKSVLLLGREAHALTNYFAHAGMQCHTRRTDRVDMLFVACGEMSAQSCAKAAALLGEDGLMVWLMDVRNVSMARFQTMLASFALPEVHLWALGADHWLLTGRKTPQQVKLSSMLELFAHENAFDDLAAAHCNGLPDLFANYVGCRADVEPAFQQGNLDVAVRPEFVLTQEIPKLDWIAADELVDADMRTRTFTDLHAAQNARRYVVEGNMLSQKATDKKGEEAAIEKWVRACRCNPNDLMLLERLDRLDRNARGFLKVGKVLLAMKCYETMVLVRPNDAAAVHNFGMCLKKIGKLDMAAKVLKHADDLSRAAGGQ